MPKGVFTTKTLNMNSQDPPGTTEENFILLRSKLKIRWGFGMAFYAKLVENAMGFGLREILKF